MNESLDPELTVNNESETVEETKSVIENAPIQLDVTEKPSLPVSKSLTKEEILETFKKVEESGTIPPRTEVELLKQAYYKLRSAEVEVQRTAFVADGSDVADFLPSIDPSEELVKTYLNTIKEKRAKLIAGDVAQREQNYLKKIQIIEAMKNLSLSTDDFNKLYKEFKELQQQWASIKAVPASKERELWASYQISSEKFYDLIKINNEFRDYDFKKNQELKIAICESTEKLIEDLDVVSAFYQLQNFHNQWREIGPISIELREVVWNRFKDASTAINKKYQTHFENLKGKEEDNLVQKVAICDALKTIDYTLLTSMKTWDEKSREVIALQAKWKTIGFVPRKVNSQIFEEFRLLCDQFFAKKSDFFKGIKDEMDVNLEKKKALCERVKVLKDSDDWRKTTDELIGIQKEWKKIGAVSRKHSDAIWHEFVAACDYFFEQKKKNTSSHKGEEDANLAAKNEIVEKINKIDSSLDANAAIAQVKQLSDEWHAIGFVPFKEKDKSYKEYHRAVDAHYDRLKVDKVERRMDAFKSTISDLSKSTNVKQKLQKEKEYLLHQFAKLKTDLQTYENNMSFFSFSSKGASSLLKDVNRKMEELKTEMELITKKVKALDTSIRGLEG